jgi:2-iminoacetate synthase
MSFVSVLEKHPWEAMSARIAAATRADAERALARAERGDCGFDDFLALISPAAAHLLEPMAQLSHARTVRRFGRTMQMYAPLYLSNECQNVCTYCGFSVTNKIPRRTLTPGEILREAGVLKKLGFEHVLIVTGEAPRHVGIPYFCDALDLLRPHFANLSMEVQPLDTDEYSKLREHGLNTVLVYQETYHTGEYRKHHPRGRKSDFNWRVETADRLGAAGMHKVGLGALFGLEDWRTDAAFVALHLEYLEKTYWRTRYSVSFPRLRPHEGEVQPKVEMSERDLVQTLAAFRLFNGEVELSLSTRESQKFRDHAFKLGFTSMSAGSKTNPGGYAEGDDASLEQFEIDDNRSPEEVRAMLRAAGYEPIAKDWDASYEQKNLLKI